MAKMRIVPRDSPESKDPRYRLARERASALLTLRRQKPPVDVDAIIHAARISVVERILRKNVRGTIGEIGGQRAIIINRHWQFSSEAERRWVLAEELGHVLLDHRLVESVAPGEPSIGLLEWQRDTYEREAKAFASELLMPLSNVRERWFAESQEIARAAGERDRKEAQGRVVRKLARVFGVTMTAMRIRLEQLKLV